MYNNQLTNNRQVVISMGEKTIRKETKKPKKSAETSGSKVSTMSQVVTQPPIIKKEKKKK